MKFTPLLVAVFATSAQAASPMESALNNYFLVVAGTYTSVRCNWLTDNQEKDSVGYVGILTEALAKEISSSQVVLNHHNAAIEFAKQEKFKSCDDEARKLGNAGIDYGKAWGEQVKAAYRAAQSPNQMR
jgi:uncharacterized protein (DUF305 family)